MFDKFREKLCKFIMPKTLRAINADEFTVNELMDEHVKTIDQLPSIFSKNFLEELIKEYPKFDQPNLLESEGNIKFVDEKGHAVQLKVPLLTIVPIPYISKDDVDLDQYLKENFGDTKTPKKMEDIKGVQIDVPALNIVPIPNISKDIDISFDKKANKNNK
jgi:hypothetical protein